MNEGEEGRERELRYNDGFAPASFVLAAVAAIVDHVQSPESNAGRQRDEGGGEGLTDRGRPLHQVSVHPLSHPYSEQRPSSFAALFLSFYQGSRTLSVSVQSFTRFA